MFACVVCVHQYTCISFYFIPMQTHLINVTAESERQAYVSNQKKRRQHPGSINHPRVVCALKCPSIETRDPLLPASPTRGLKSKVVTVLHVSGSLATSLVEYSLVPPWPIFPTVMILPSHQTPGAWEEGSTDRSRGKTSDVAVDYDCSHRVQMLRTSEVIPGFQHWRASRERLSTAPFFIISTIGWTFVSSWWFYSDHEELIALQFCILAFVIVPGFVVGGLAIFALKTYASVWNVALSCIVVGVALVVALMIASDHACMEDTILVQACYGPVEPLVSCLYVLMPFVFRANEKVAGIANSLALIIQMICFSFGTWSSQSTIYKLYLVAILCYVASLLGLLRNQFLRGVDDRLVEHEIQRAKRLEDKLEALESLERNLGEDEEFSMSGVHCALATAINGDAPKNLREKAWKVLQEWIRDDANDMKISQAYYARDEPSEAGGENKLHRTTTMRFNLQDVAGFTFKSQEAKQRRKMKMVAGISAIRSWMKELKMLDKKRHFDISASKKVFLGGSCNPTTWRADIVIPKLERHGIPYYNPQVDEWTPELVPIEAKAKDEAGLLFFVIDGATNAVASMMEVVEYASSGRQIVCVIRDIEENSKLGKLIGKTTLKDLNRGRAYVWDTGRRHGISLYKDIGKGLDEVVRLCKENVSGSTCNKRTLSGARSSRPSNANPLNY